MISISRLLVYCCCCSLVRKPPAVCTPPCHYCPAFTLFQQRAVSSQTTTHVWKRHGGLGQELLTGRSHTAAVSMTVQQQQNPPGDLSWVGTSCLCAQDAERELTAMRVKPLPHRGVRDICSSEGDIECWYYLAKETYGCVFAAC